MARLDAIVQAACNGVGGIAVVSGEAGVGKTRVLDEISRRAASRGVAVLRGSIDPGAPRASHAAFRGAIEGYARSVGLATMLAELGDRATALARFAPLFAVSDQAEALRRLDPEEERLRVLDAVAHIVRCATRRSPVLFVLDDLQWADGDALSLLRRVAREAEGDRLVLLLAHRDESFDASRLAQVLGDLRQRADVQRIRLGGLTRDEVTVLLADGNDSSDVPEVLIELLDSKTDGNPFLIRHLLAHLLEAGRVQHQQGRWLPVDLGSPGVPLGVSEVVRQRIEGLTDAARQLLVAASAFDAPFPFGVVADCEGLDETSALDALDDAISAGLVRHSSGVDHHVFTHALVRDAIYTGMSATRRVHLHRRLAETMSASPGTTAEPLAPSVVAEQFARSIALPGAEAGVSWAMKAADDAERSVAYAEASQHVTAALEMLPVDDPRRAQLLARRALNEAYGGDPSASVTMALEAADAAAPQNGVELLERVVTALVVRGYERPAWELARRGLELASDRRTVAWAKLTLVDHRRQVAEEPDSWGRVPDEVWDDLKRLLLPLSINERLIFLPKWKSRAEALAAKGDTNSIRLYTAGDLRTTLPRAEQGLAEARALGGPGRILGWASTLVRIRTARGFLAEARTLLNELDPLAASISSPTPFIAIWLAARDEMRLATDEGWEQMADDFTGLGAADEAANSFAAVPIYAALARVAARLGDSTGAGQFLGHVLPALEALPGWYLNYTRMIVDAAEVLWFTGETGHLAMIEHNLHTKVIAPDFRFPMFDARHALARLATVDGRIDEARKWFAAARVVLHEDLAEPSLAIVDHDEGVALTRNGDSSSARPLLEAAHRRFVELGMPGWQRRAEALLDA